MGLAGCTGLVPSAGQRGAPPPQRASGTAPAARPVPAKPMDALPAARPTNDISTARGLGIVQGPPVASLPVAGERTRLALQAFRITCGSLLRRTDHSGLTRGRDWQPDCTPATSWSDGNAGAFFDRYFETIQVGAGAAFATGYFEPEIAGARHRPRGHETPFSRRPPALADADMGRSSETLKGHERTRVVYEKSVPVRVEPGERRLTTTKS